MGNTVTYHYRVYFDIVALISKAGGIYASLFAFFGILGKYINTQSFMSELMREMQFVSLKDTDTAGKEDPQISLRTNLLYDVDYGFKDTLV